MTKTIFFTYILPHKLIEEAEYISKEYKVLVNRDL